jgi:hypothetical protein
MTAESPSPAQELITLFSHYVDQRRRPTPKAGGHICVHIDDLNAILQELRNLSEINEALEQQSRLNESLMPGVPGKKVRL